MRVVVYGAGAIGCYLGAKLESQAEVVYVSTPRSYDALCKGIRVHDGDSLAEVSSPNVVTKLTSLAGVDFIIVCVSCCHTQAVVDALCSLIDSTTSPVILSAQNGVGNVHILEQLGLQVFQSIVGFNIVRSQIEGWSNFTRTTDGVLWYERHDSLFALNNALVLSGIPVRAVNASRISRVMHAKLLLNTLNGIQVLSGLPTAVMLGKSAYRCVYAACIDEGLEATSKYGVKYTVVQSVPMLIVPCILRLPDTLYNWIAGSLVSIDYTAVSSMAMHMERGSPTEVQYLNGELVRLMRMVHKRDAPCNRVILELVQQPKEVYSGERLLNLTGAPQGYGYPGIILVLGLACVLAYEFVTLAIGGYGR